MSERIRLKIAANLEKFISLGEKTEAEHIRNQMIGSTLALYELQEWLKTEPPSARTKRLVWFKEDAPIPMSAVYLKERREGLTQRIVGEGRYEYDAYTEFLYEVYDEEKT